MNPEILSSFASRWSLFQKHLRQRQRPHNLSQFSLLGQIAYLLLHKVRKMIRLACFNRLDKVSRFVFCRAATCSLFHHHLQLLLTIWYFICLGYHPLLVVAEPEKHLRLCLQRIGSKLSSTWTSLQSKLDWYYKTKSTFHQ